jgi:hypothetical protein
VFSDNARNHISRSARGKRNNDRDGPRWIALRCRYARQNRQRGSARSQMQKLPTMGKDHGFSPGKLEVRTSNWKCSPAAGTNAAKINEDFGTSPWQLDEQATSINDQCKSG